MFLFHQSVSIDDPNADKLKSLLFTPLKIIQIGEITVISIGVTIVLATVIVGIVHRVRNNHVSMELHLTMEFHLPLYETALYGQYKILRSKNHFLAKSAQKFLKKWGVYCTF